MTQILRLLCSYWMYSYLLFLMKNEIFLCGHPIGKATTKTAGEGGYKKQSTYLNKTVAADQLIF